MTSVSELWVEKYRPKSAEDLIVSEANQFLKQQIQDWIKEGSIPNLMFSGPAGCGKTTIAEILLNIADPNDRLVLNASHANGIAIVREELDRFISTMPYGKIKIVFLDEFDRLSPEAQDALKRVIEGSSSYVRFIVACNREHMVKNELKSRFAHFKFDKADEIDIIERCLNILVAEGIKFKVEDVQHYVTAAYPDIRKAIMNLEQYTSKSSKKLQSIAAIEHVDDYKIELLKLIKAGNWHAARELVCKSASGDDWIELYTFLYNNVNNWFPDDLQLTGNLVILIAKYMYQHSFVADPEINCASLFYEIINTIEG